MSSLTNKSGVGEASICDESGQKIPEFKIESISIDKKSSLISSPIEIGEKRFDNKVLEPICIDVTGYVAAEDFEYVLKELKTMYENRTYKFYRIYTKEPDPYDNMCLQNMPSKQTSDKYDVIYFTLHFQQMMITKMSKRKTPAQASDKATVKT